MPERTAGRTGIRSGRRPGLLLVFLTLLSCPPSPAQTPGEDGRGSELETLRTRIRDVRSSIDEAKKDVDTYRTDLQQSEMAAAEMGKSLQALTDEIARRQLTLEQLQIESGEQRLILDRERRLLAEQLRIAYKTGRHDFLKLFLNQEDPAMTGRMMTYHDYYNRARARRIGEIRMTLQNLQSLATRIDSETGELQRLRNQQAGRLEQLASYRESRNAIISSLQDYISGQGRELESLVRDEQELGKLLDDLDEVQSTVELYEELPPFDNMKGKLSWPVAGRLITRFGTEKKEGRLRWNGVRIAAESGASVTAVGPGKVIFADWFRNLGLLIIIDHGHGYMSLYGHNADLTRKAGEYVNMGEQIASVGDTGGQGEPALYFEIRQQGTPLDPALWCRD